MDHSLSFYSVGFSAIEGILHVHTSQSISHWPHVTLCSWNVARVSWELNSLNCLIADVPIFRGFSCAELQFGVPAFLVMLLWDWLQCVRLFSQSGRLIFFPLRTYSLPSLCTLSWQKQEPPKLYLSHYPLLFLLNTLFKNLHKAGCI